MDSNSLKSREKRATRNMIITSALALVALVGIGYAMMYLIEVTMHNPQYQYDGYKSQIENMKLTCGEGFNGTEYGYTGEIFQHGGIFNQGKMVVPMGFKNVLSDEQIDELVLMLKSKIKSMPCYDEYLEWSKNQ